MRIAIVEDNKPLANGIAHQLRDQGHAVNLLHDGQVALDFLLQEGADIVVLDINLPALDGISVLKSLRKAGQTVPILLLTARGDLQDRVRGLDAGADDYMVKPFDIEELDARLRALIRRKPLAQGGDITQFGTISFDRAGRKIYAQGQEIALPRRFCSKGDGALQSSTGTGTAGARLNLHRNAAGRDNIDETARTHPSERHGGTLSTDRPGIGYAATVKKKAFRG